MKRIPNYSQVMKDNWANLLFDAKYCCLCSYGKAEVLKQIKADEQHNKKDAEKWKRTHKTELKEEKDYLKGEK